jgi:parvulin-like peptidyl-prolyl isomerase
VQNVRTFLSLLALVFLLTSAACGPSAATSASAPTNVAADVSNSSVAQQPTSPSLIVDPGTPSIAQPVNAQGQPLVAAVNGTEITQAEFDRAVTRFQQQQLTAADPQALRATVLDTLIDQALIEQEAAEQEITVTDADVQAEYDVNMSAAGSEQALVQWMAENMYTPEEYRESLRESLITTQMRDRITQNLTGTLMQVHARHILVDTEAQANDILQRLQQGEDFGGLAAQFSKDVTTREQGGDLGWFAQSELLEPYLAQVAFSLEPGAIAGPVPTTLGFHIIQTLEKEDRPIPDEKRASLAQNEFELWLQSLRGEATIERYI